LAAGETGPSVARILHVNQRTVREWRNDPEFQEELQALELRIRAERIVQISDLRGKALLRLMGILDDPNAETRHVLEAAKTVLRYTETPPVRIIQLEGKDGTPLPTAALDGWTPDQLIRLAHGGSLSPELLDIQPEDPDGPPATTTIAIQGTPDAPR
jgi:hypothetical protein